MSEGTSQSSCENPTEKFEMYSTSPGTQVLVPHSGTVKVFFVVFVFPLFSLGLMGVRDLRC